jgi:hypothetical protein
MEEKMVYPCNVKKSIDRVPSSSPVKHDDFFDKILKQKAAKKQAQEMYDPISKFEPLKPSYTINRKIDEIYHLMNSLKVSTARTSNKISTAVPKKVPRTAEKLFHYDKDIFNATDKEMYLQSIKKNLEHFNHKKQEIQNNRKDHFASFDEKIEMLKRKTKTNEEVNLYESNNNPFEASKSVEIPAKTNENVVLVEGNPKKEEIQPQTSKINDQVIHGSQEDKPEEENQKENNKFEVFEESKPVAKKSSLQTRSVNPYVEVYEKKEEPKIEEVQSEQHVPVRPRHSSRLPNYD